MPEAELGFLVKVMILNVFIISNPIFDAVHGICSIIAIKHLKSAFASVAESATLRTCRTDSQEKLHARTEGK